MIYKTNYKSPIGNLLLLAKDNSLIGLYIEGQKYYKNNIEEEAKENNNYSILIQTKKWLDQYFNFEKPSINELTINLYGSSFRKDVWKILTKIPYGTTITYNDIAKEIAKNKNVKKVSAQAVGGAVAHNPISIIIPCHRVVGTNGSLTGYAGGLDKKVKLLKHEKTDMTNLFFPKNNQKKECIDTKRCKWCNLNNKLYIDYHDNEWCKLNLTDNYLFEMLILESFQAGLSWECILNKRSDFKLLYDNFDINKVMNYDDEKIEELLSNPKIIRNKLKIKASINNAKIFKKIQNEFGSFHEYLKTFTDDKVIYEIDKTTNHLSDKLSEDLKKRGMKFVGSTIIYSYLQAIGIIYSHDKDCFMYKNSI